MKKIELLVRTLSDIWLLALFYFSGGAVQALYNSRNLYVQVLIPLWFDSNFAFSIIIATVFYLFVWRYDRVMAIGWFLLYDALFQLTNAVVSPVDATTIIFLLFAFLIFYVNDKFIKWDDVFIVNFIWCMLAAFTAFTLSQPYYQMIMAGTLIFVCWRNRDCSLLNL